MSGHNWRWDEMRENPLKWFGYVKRRPAHASVRKLQLWERLREKGVKEDLGRLRKKLSKKTWGTLENLELTEDLTQNQA